MTGSVHVDVDAPAELVFLLVRDPLRWERLLPHYSRSRLVRRERDGSVVAAFVARRSLVPRLGLELPVGWRSRSWNDPASRRLHFHHLGGATDGMHATWEIEQTHGGCRVTIEHSYPPRRRAFAMVVDRLFARPIAGRTLATFKAIAEALAADRPVAASGATADGQRESGEATATKSSV